MSPNVKNLQNGQKLWYNYDLSGFTGSAAFHFRNSILAMIKTSTIKFVVVFASLLLGTIAVPAQTTRPLLQDIKIYKPEPTPSEGSLVKPIGSSAAIAATPVNAVRTMFPLLAEQTIPGYSGILVETMDGGVVVESNSSALFNPASNVKLATAYAVLKTFGPDFRFATNVYTNGTLDRTTGTLTGNLYVSGKDPVFNYEHAILIANELNRRGIRSITGDIIVTNDFVMNYSGSSQYAANTLLATLDLAKRSPSAARAWVDYLNNSGRAGMFQNLPSVSVTGTASVQPIPSDLSLLFTHESAKMREILKATLCYSNNFLAERLGDMIGGPFGVSRIVELNANVPDAEFSLSTTSGLGINRVSPNAMMKLLRSLQAELGRYRMNFADIMPVAGLDEGTLENRFDNDFYAGSVVGKTGTLRQTDNGVSALSGEVNTQKGKLLFVIFNQRGSVNQFRSFQNLYVSLVQGQFGGPVSFNYTAVSLDKRMATSRISYPNSASH